ncbi:siderophore-iron reductase FhuF [Halomonas sp. TRM85114]|uniref:siderophore-iron reductase FhuF n=1 Tax=Halomonas jincaotanensis TaxID=2810616 RepID=UPI001BD20F50|nr:siderophore-iron reductase FhuF [Halomonas jincaotanensis]MBS9402146.1 siderophore-iron reductase FhuF [Halomonas jincaotanensis]
MTPALSSLCVGPLEGLTPPRISMALGADTLPARELLDPARLAALFDRFGIQYGHGDRRAVGSLWSKWYFSVLSAHSLAANLLLERDLPLGLDDLHLQQSPDGRISGLTLRHAGCPLSDLAPYPRFATLLDGNLTPLIEALAATTGASPKVFWSNAGNYFEYFAGTLAGHPMALPGVAEPAQVLMKSRTLPDGRRNPLYRPVRYVEPVAPDRPRRVRRLCCIRYLIEGLGYCTNCPMGCRRTTRIAREDG